MGCLFVTYSATLKPLEDDAYMKKLIVFVLVLTFMLSVADCASMRDGTMDTLELDEISDYTQEQLEERLIGRSQEDLHNTWGEARWYTLRFLG